MPSLKIISGFKKQEVTIFAGIMVINSEDGSRRTYQFKDSIENVEKISEDKKNVLFNVVLRDGTNFRAEAVNSVFYDFAKYAGASNNPKFVTEMPASKAKMGDRIAAVVVTFLILVGIYACTSREKEVSQPRIATIEDKKSYAYIYCKNIIEKTLKAPKTAEFPWGVSAVFVDGKYIVNSYVDAENSFGAHIRTRFMCKLSHLGNDEYAGWSLEDLKIFD